MCRSGARRLVEWTDRTLERPGINVADYDIARNQFGIDIDRGEDSRKMAAKAGSAAGRIVIRRDGAILWRQRDMASRQCDTARSDEGRVQKYERQECD